MVRRWWLALFLGSCVAGVVGYIAASQAPKTFEARTNLLVGPINTDVALDASGALARTYADLAISRPALQSAIEDTKAKLSVKELSDATSTTSNAITRIVSISVQNHDPEMAARLANTLAERLIAVANRLPADSTAALDAFAARPELDVLSAGDRLGVVDAARRVFGTSTAGRLHLVERANPPTAAAKPVIPLLTVLAALGGLLVSGLVVLWIEGRQRRKVDEHALAGLGYTFLGAVETPGGRTPAKATAVEDTPDSAEATEYRLLAARLELCDEGGLRNLLVVDSVDGRAAAVVALNLAAAAAQAGRRVLLADVNTGEGGVTSLLGLQGRQGYTNAVDNPAITNGRLAKLMVKRADGLVVLPSGTGKNDRKLSTGNVHRVLARLREQLDVVVLSGPALSRSPSALVWSRAADRTVCVVDERASPAEGVLQAVGDLASVNGRFAGTILARRGSRFRLRRAVG